MDTKVTKLNYRKNRGLLKAVRKTSKTKKIVINKSKSEEASVIKTIQEPIIKTSFLTDNFESKTPIKAIMLIMRYGKKEISLEPDNSINKIIMKVHTNTGSGYPIVKKINFKDLASFIKKI